jgi:hypothetical protein
MNAIEVARLILSMVISEGLVLTSWASDENGCRMMDFNSKVDCEPDK